MNEQRDKIISLYKERNNNRKIAEKLGITKETVGKYLKNENLLSWRRRTDFFNQDYFEKIDSKDKAYFLGLLYADGNIYPKRRRMQITLWEKDMYILEKFRDCISSTTKLYIDRGKYPKFILDSEKLMNDLIKLGCGPKKAFGIRFPTEEQVPKEFQSHFIRGFFDGDGSVFVGKSGLAVNITSNETFLKELMNILSLELIESTAFHKRYKDKENSSGTIYIGKRDSQKALRNYMYNECDDLFLTRKKDNFDVFVDKPLTR